MVHKNNIMFAALPRSLFDCYLLQHIIFACKTVLSCCWVTAGCCCYCSLLLLAAGLLQACSGGWGECWAGLGHIRDHIVHVSKCIFVIKV